MEIWRLLNDTNADAGSSDTARQSSLFSVLPILENYINLSVYQKDESLRPAKATFCINAASWWNKEESGQREHLQRIANIIFPTPISFEACSLNVHGGICLKSENLQQKKVVASDVGGLKVMDGKEEEVVDMMTIKEKQDEINRTALEADSSIKIQKRGKSVIMFYVFLL